MQIFVLLLLAGLIGCRSIFTSNRIHEEHRFPTGELLTCDSWIEGGFQSRIGRTMQCWIEMPGSMFKEDLKETWLSEGQTQPDGPNMLAASHRLAIHRSGESVALLMDNSLLYNRPDLHNAAIGWVTWHIADDRLAKIFLRAVVSDAQEAGRKVPATGATKNSRDGARKSDSTAALGTPQPWMAYQISQVDLPSLRVLAELRPNAGGSAGLPARLIFLPRKLNPEINLDVEETLAANPGLQLPGFPPDVVFEWKVAETIDGKTHIIRREILEPLAGFQTVTQEFRLADGSASRLTYSLKAGFRNGENLVFYGRAYGLPDADPLETKPGEWHSAGGVGWGSDMEKHSGTMYLRCIHRGQESPAEEVPVPMPWDMSRQ